VPWKKKTDEWWISFLFFMNNFHQIPTKLLFVQKMGKWHRKYTSLRNVKTFIWNGFDGNVKLMKHEENTQEHTQCHICTVDEALSATDRYIDRDTSNRSWNCWPVWTKCASGTMGVQKYCNMFEKYGLLHTAYHPCSPLFNLRLEIMKGWMDASMDQCTCIQMSKSILFKDH
jgi:hypothetical protein